MGSAQVVEASTSDLEMNMTPMIDVVFQLIIFLMLANDMSRREIEDLALPLAPHGAEDPGLEKHRVVVNLLAGKAGGPPVLKVRGAAMDLDGLKQLLAAEAARGPGLFVLVRADTTSRWQDVQWVMQACADPKVRIHQVQFATTNPASQEGR